MTMPSDMISVSQRQQRGDSAGLALSGLCLLHCLIAPVILALIPALSLGQGAGHELDRAIHGMLLLIAAPISAWSLRHGLRTHGRMRCLALALVGLGFMLAGALLHTPGHGEIWLTVTGVVILAGAHVMNWHGTRSCDAGPAGALPARVR